MTYIETIRKDLFSLANENYRDFQAALIPNIPKESVIGVRTPILRKYALKIARDPQINDFLGDLPHYYYEENNLHAFIIEQMTNYDECIRALDTFLPYVDNWATCDLMSPKVFKNSTDLLIGDIKRYLTSGHTYTVRFGIVMLMRYYLDDDFDVSYFDLAADANNEDYYVKMAVAWFFATALTNRFDEVLKYFESCSLDKWTRNKAISKANDSFRISREKKEILKNFRIK